MDERQAIIAELERLDVIAQLEALDAAEPEGPSAGEMAAHFGRSALPFVNEARGAIDATAMKVFAGDETPWGELQDLYSDDQDAEEAMMVEEHPEIARNLGIAGGLTGTLATAGGLGNLIAKQGAKRLTALKPRLTVRATASKPRVRLQAGSKKIRNPQYSVRVPAQVAAPAEIAAPVTASGGLKSAIKTAGVVGAATALGGPGAGSAAALVALLRTPMGKKLAHKGARKAFGDDIGEIVKHTLHSSNRKWVKDLTEKLRQGAD